MFKNDVNLEYQVPLRTFLLFVFTWHGAEKTTYMLVCTVYILVGLAFTSTIIELVRLINQHQLQKTALARRKKKLFKVMKPF